jgi:hypothetical protein
MVFPLALLALLTPLCEDVVEVFVALLGVLESPSVCVLVVQLDAPSGQEEVVCAWANEADKTTTEKIMQCLMDLPCSEIYCSAMASATALIFGRPRCQPLSIGPANSKFRKRQNHEPASSINVNCHRAPAAQHNHWR